MQSSSSARLSALHDATAGSAAAAAATRATEESPSSSLSLSLNPSLLSRTPPLPRLPSVLLLLLSRWLSDSSAVALAHTCRAIFLQLRAGYEMRSAPQWHVWRVTAEAAADALFLDVSRPQRLECRGSCTTGMRSLDATVREHPADAIVVAAANVSADARGSSDPNRRVPFPHPLLIGVVTHLMLAGCVRGRNVFALPQLRFLPHRLQTLEVGAIQRIPPGLLTHCTRLHTIIFGQTRDAYVRAGAEYPASLTRMVFCEPFRLRPTQIFKLQAHEVVFPPTLLRLTLPIGRAMRYPPNVHMTYPPDLQHLNVCLLGKEDLTLRLPPSLISAVLFGTPRENAQLPLLPPRLRCLRVFELSATNCHALGEVRWPDSLRCISLNMLNCDSSKIHWPRHLTHLAFGVWMWLAGAALRLPSELESFDAGLPLWYARDSYLSELTQIAFPASLRRLQIWSESTLTDADRLQLTDLRSHLPVGCVIEHGTESAAHRAKHPLSQPSRWPVRTADLHALYELARTSVCEHC